MPERERLRDELVARARHDESVTAAALVGSAAAGREDRWSDIDLALRLQPGAEVADAAARWTGWLVEDHDVVDHTDVWAGPALYRVFLTGSALQVDVSFWPDTEFGPRGADFRLLLGAAVRSEEQPGCDTSAAVGTAWLHALHVRSALGRARPHEAVHHLDQLRDRVVVLACVRHGLDWWHGRGVDALPVVDLDRLAAARPPSLGPDHLGRSLTLMVELLLEEVDHLDPARARHLCGPLAGLAPGAPTSPA